MKFPTSRIFKGIIYLFMFAFTTLLSAQVGIGTTTPVEMLDVNGNLKLDGALMPGNAFGGVDQMLLSQGSGTPPVWGPGFINTSQITNIGKWYVGPFDSNASTFLVLTVADPDMTVDSTVAFNFVGPLPFGPPGPPGPQWGNTFRVFADPQAGQVVFYITNASTYNITGLQIAFVAYYH